MKKRKKEKGITLIALVVTIVILLILAGVSISMLTGENGIISQAQDAKLVTERASLREKLQLVAVEEIDRDSLEIFKSLGYVGEDNVVKVEAIPDLQLTTGKGTNGKDIYGIITQGNKYYLKYITQEGEMIDIGEVGQVIEGNPFSYTQADIDETLKYFKWVIVEVTEELKEQKGYSDDTVGKKVAIIYDTVEDYYEFRKGETFPIKKIVIPNKIEDSDFVDISYSFNDLKNVDTMILLNDYGIFDSSFGISAKNIKLSKYGKFEQIVWWNKWLETIEKIKVDAESPYYSTINDVIFSKDMKDLYFYSKTKNNTSYTIPDSITSIKKYAFYYGNILTEITIPSSVTTIEYDAFSGCSNLRTVNYKGTREQWEAITIGNGNGCLRNTIINYNYTGE